MMKKTSADSKSKGKNAGSICGLRGAVRERLLGFYFD